MYAIKWRVKCEPFSRDSGEKPFVSEPHHPALCKSAALFTFSSTLHTTEHFQRRSGLTHAHHTRIRKTRYCVAKGLKKDFGEGERGTSLSIGHCGEVYDMEKKMGCQERVIGTKRQLLILPAKEKGQLD